MWTGMAPIKRVTLDFFARARLPLYEAYGLTECGPIATNTPGRNRLGSVGRRKVKTLTEDANDLLGPWTVHEPGVLQLSSVPACRDHIASPDVHVDQDQRQIRMYFHCPAAELNADMRNQKTLVSFSPDGLNFTAKSELLGPSYFRVFRWDGHYYAIARGGVFLRSKDGVSKFEEGPTPFPREPLLRHAAVDLIGDTLSVYYSRIGDSPESILLSKIRLSSDWRDWRASPPVTLLAPDTDAEGANLPSEPSKPDAAPGRLQRRSGCQSGPRLSP